MDLNRLYCMENNHVFKSNLYHFWDASTFSLKSNEHTDSQTMNGFH